MPFGKGADGKTGKEKPKYLIGKTVFEGKTKVSKIAIMELNMQRKS